MRGVYMSVYDFSATDIQGSERALSEFTGKVLLIVNTASKCGFTPQFEGLESMYKDLSEKGLEILGFPCNQFAEQDKGSDTEIAGFCMKNYGVSFPMFSKIDVNGDGEHPLYKYLKSEAKGILGTKKIKWNFTKFLVNQKGEVVKRYGSTSKPKDIQKDVAALLGA
jgi:glutathione peroxidase